jgi:transcriptional regulator with XRE-family HTH domain
VSDAPSPVAARFGCVVRKSREVQGLSQEALADLAGLHRTYISMIERGTRTPSIAVVEKLARALGAGMGDLLSQAEEQR